MKILVAIGVVAVILGAVLWMLYLGDRDDGAADTRAAASQDHDGEAAADQRVDPSAGDEPQRDQLALGTERVDDAVAHGRRGPADRCTGRPAGRPR